MWLRQRDGVTCGPSVAVTAGALIDAEYGAPLRDGEPEHAQTWFAAEQGRVHRAVNRVWPRALGTTPAGMARALSAHGVAYRWRRAGRSMSDVLSAVSTGRPVAMLIGGVIPRHWVLLTEVDGSAMRCYDPASGQRSWISVADIREARLRGLGFPRPFAFVLPAG